MVVQDGNNSGNASINKQNFKYISFEQVLNIKTKSNIYFL
jgi:myo-inositol-hexaphosphate 3-phosphohydrolase